MRLTIIFLLFFTFQVNATGFAQRITISKTNVSIPEVFKAIEQQSKYLFFYDKDMMQQASTIDVDIKDATLEQALNVCLRGQPFTYSIVKNTVVIRSKKSQAIPAVFEDISEKLKPPVEIRGRITNREGTPLPGVSVFISGTQTGTTTNSEGFLY